MCELRRSGDQQAFRRSADRVVRDFEGRVHVFVRPDEAVEHSVYDVLCRGVELRRFAGAERQRAIAIATGAVEIS